MCFKGWELLQVVSYWHLLSGHSSGPLIISVIHIHGMHLKALPPASIAKAAKVHDTCQHGVTVEDEIVSSALHTIRRP